MGNFVSTNSTPRLYEGITLLLADPEKQFPEEFDPKHPFKTRKIKKLSREGFIRMVERENGITVVPYEDFGPKGVEEAPEEVELRNGATFIVVPREDKTTAKRVSSFCRILLSVGDFQLIADLGNLNFTSYLRLFPFDFAV